MTDNQRPNTTLLLFLTSVILLFLFIAINFKGCGFEPTKKKIVEREVPEVVIPPEPTQCEEGKSVRKSECSQGLVGEIVEVCSSDGKWIEASNTCKSACDSQASWEGSIKELIVTNCAECHGQYRSYEAVRNIASQPVGGITGSSKLLFYVDLPETDDRSMPKGRPNLKPDEIKLLKDWVAAEMPLGSECVEKSGFKNLDYIESEVIAYLSKITSERDRKHYRFFNFASILNGGGDLNGAYQAVNLLLNSLSFEQDTYLCKPIDRDGTICAVDIRSYGLSIDDFLEFEKATDIPFVSDTTKGEIIEELTRTDFAIIHYENIISTITANANLYYTFMGFEDTPQTLGLFGIDYARQILDVDYSLIGTNESAISSARNTRLIAIFEGRVNGRDTQCHISFDNPALEGADRDLFQSPFIDPTRSDKIFKFEASEAICGLPNGLHAYFLSNNVNVFQSFAPENIVFCNAPYCLDATINNPIDCMGCHQDGYIPKVDVIRDHIVTSGLFNKEEIDLAKLVYLDSNTNAATFNAHNFAFENGLKSVGRKVGESNHLARTHNSFFKSWDINQVASFLMVPELELSACITGSAVLKNQIGVLLTGGKITHDTLAQAFGNILFECGINQDPIIKE